MLDTIIKNVRIIDGTNAPWYRADIGIKYGKISKIGTINAESSDGNCGLSAAPVSYDEEKKEMLRALLRQSLADGAFAMSSGLIYPPGCYADKDELIALCAELPAYHAFYATHMREEGLQELRILHAENVCGMTPM